MVVGNVFTINCMRLCINESCDRILWIVQGVSHVTLPKHVPHILAVLTLFFASLDYESLFRVHQREDDNHNASKM